MTINKIKTWLQSIRNPQFRVLERYADSVNIKAVQRIKDDAIFVRFIPIQIVGRDDTMDSFFITNFHDDMKTVDWEVWETENVVKGSCDINYVFMNDDGRKLINVAAKKHLNRKK